MSDVFGKHSGWEVDGKTVTELRTPKVSTGTVVRKTIRLRLRWCPEGEPVTTPRQPGGEKSSTGPDGTDYSGVHGVRPDNGR